MNNITPPRWPIKLLKFFLKKDYLEEIEGDMEEVFQDNLNQYSEKKARRRYLLDTLKLLKPALIKNLEGTHRLNNYGMFKNNLKSIIRNMNRHKMYATINITGLAIGLAGSLFIWQYIKHESSYEDFHVKADNIYRITSENGNTAGFRVHWARTPQDWVDEVVAELPEVIAQIRFQNFMPRIVKVGSQSFKEEHAYSVNSSVFDVFSFPFILGEKKTALVEPYSVVLTETIAQKYFDNQNPIGKIIQILHNGESVLYDYKVTGVMKDTPSNTHFPVTMLTSFRSFNERKDWAYNYLLMTNEVNIEQTEDKLIELIKPHTQENDYFKLHLQPLKYIHLHSHLAREIIPSGDIFYVRLFGAVGIFILLMAIINFSNLSTIKSMQRSKEVGVRKVLGSGRSNIFWYFITDSIFYATISSVFALGIIFLSKPLFQEASGVVFNFDSQLIYITAILILLTGILSGIYPAILMSSFKPINALKGNLNSSLKSKLSLRQILVSFQFVIFIAISSGAFITMSQFDFLQNKKLGFDQNQILAITNNPLSAQSNYEVLKYELGKIDGVQEVSANMQVPSEEIRDTGTIYFEGFDEGNNDVMMDIQVIDDNYLSFMDIEILAGRKFSSSLKGQKKIAKSVTSEEYTEHISTARREYIINETAMKLLGVNNPSEIIGKQMSWSNYFQLQRGEIVAVVKNSHQETLRNKIDPLVMVYEPLWFRTFLVKVDAKNLQQTLAEIDNVWQELNPNYPLESAFLDDMFQKLYNSEQRQRDILFVFSALIIFIALLGMLGLTSFIIQRRRKELAIRKVLGASLISFFLLLGRGFVFQALVAICIAIPITRYFIEDWLSNFAYRISTTHFEFFLSAVALILVLGITMALQIKKSITQNPAETLKYE